MPEHEIHTLTLTETGEVFITEHAGDPFTLHSWCYEAKRAVARFADPTAPAWSPDLIPPEYRPVPGVYSFGIADNGSLNIGSLIHPLTEQEPPT